jgi:hypothetical protein
MAIDINIPSQVKNYANLAAFPATGTLKTIFIAEDTNKTYRWTGSAYVEISASQATAWGTITGTLSAQTDLNTALSGKVPTSRTLTINGTTQDLSADRTFTISTGITIGTTAITSGTVGRVLFEGTGNVVQESANLFWDNTNGRLGIGTSTPSVPLEVNGNVRITQSGSTTFGVNIATTGGATTITPISSTSNITLISQNSNSYLSLAPSSVALVSRGGNLFVNALNVLAFETGASSTERARFATTTGNFLINTTTDAGFKLDVNGTARVSGTGTTSATTALTIQNSAGAISLRVTDDGSVTNYGKNAITTNTAFGIGALIKGTFGSLNSAFGQDALNGNTGGQGNNAFGRESLLSNTSGNFNAGFGNQALLSNTTGSSNSAFGLFALSSNSTGASNSALGYNTQTGNFSGSIILGRDAVANGANQFVVGSTGTNAGLVDTAVVVPDKRWKVKINGVDYYIALQTI